MTEIACDEKIMKHNPNTMKLTANRRYARGNPFFSPSAFPVLSDLIFCNSGIDIRPPLIEKFSLFRKIQAALYHNRTRRSSGRAADIFPKEKRKLLPYFPFFLNNFISLPASTCFSTISFFV